MRRIKAHIGWMACIGLLLSGCAGGSQQQPAPSGRPAATARPTTASAAPAITPQPTPVVVPTESPGTAEPLAAKPAEPEAQPVVIAIGGADGHGKTTLLAAISQSLAKQGQGSGRSYDQLNSAKGAEVAFTAGGRRLVLREYPSQQALVAALGRGEPAGVVLVVAQADGIVEQTREQITAAGKGKVRVLAVAQTKDDLVDDAELKDLEQSEIEEALVQAGLLAEKDAGTWEGGTYKPGTKLPFVRVSAQQALGGDAKAQAAITELIATIERRLAGPAAR